MEIVRKIAIESIDYILFCIGMHVFASSQLTNTKSFYAETNRRVI